jgi:hypothetical protein
MMRYYSNSNVEEIDCQDANIHVWITEKKKTQANALSFSVNFLTSTEKSLNYSTMINIAWENVYILLKID